MEHAPVLTLASMSFSCLPLPPQDTLGIIMKEGFDHRVSNVNGALGTGQWASACSWCSSGSQLGSVRSVALACSAWHSHTRGCNH